MSELPGKERRAALVEDDEQDVKNAVSFFERYREETGTRIALDIFRDGLQFIEEYRPVYDIVFMDIDMPHLDGLSAAKRLREVDPVVGLVFVTNMAQYAIRGYEVSAMDFIVKPVSYFGVKDKLDRCLRQVDRERRKSPDLLLDMGSDSFRRISVEDIYYIVKDRNYIVYQTREGEFRIRGTMKSAEEKLAGTPVVKCANGCMVNLAHVRKKVRNTVFVGEMQFSVTAPFQEEFTRAMMTYLRDLNGEG